MESIQDRNKKAGFNRKRDFKKRNINDVIQLLEQAKTSNDTWAIKTWTAVLAKLRADAEKAKNTD